MISYNKTENNIFPAGTIGIGEDIKMMQDFINKSLRNKVVSVEKIDFVPFTPQKSTSFVYIDEEKYYRLYSNGDLFSKYILRNMTKTVSSSMKNARTVYSLNKKNVSVNRLVMFYFGNHNYKKIEDMPMVSPIDKTVFNNDISNLEFANQSKLNKKYNLIPHDNFCKKPKIAEIEIENIKKMILEEVPHYKIGEKYNVSAMSVTRFLRRHNINYSQIFEANKKHKRQFY